ncbi:MAG: U32 family peptidase [Deltaproteobacteria bacterium]|nr:U32 family peptidase [Deltaproteobacteria bacterium]
MDAKLILPTNWDPALLPRVAPLRPAYLYGALPREATVRSSLVLPQATEEDVAAQIAQAAQLGIRFTYVMNATCLGNREISEDGRWEILQRLEWLRGVGAAAVVTANPYVMELARKSTPDLELQVSVLAAVNDARKAAFFRDLGADLIHIDPQINRDFRRLESIRRAVDCRLSVVVNEGCLLSCPIRQYHANTISHSVEGIERRYYVDYCYYRCSLARNADVVEYLRAPWIRPQDLAEYEAVGIDLFKIAGREKMGEGASSHTPWILKVAGAYHRRRCEDVAELLVAVQPMVGLSGEAPAPWRVRIAADRLDGFLSFFRDGRCSLDCQRCSHCAEWAKACVSAEGRAAEHRKQIENDLETLRAGSYWAGTGER